MTRGNPWTLSDEKRLRDLAKEGRNAVEIAEIMNKTFESVRMKIWNLGLSLKEEASAKQHACSSYLDLSQDLPSIDEKLKVLKPPWSRWNSLISVEPRFCIFEASAKV